MRKRILVLLLALMLLVPHASQAAITFVVRDWMQSSFQEAGDDYPIYYWKSASGNWYLGTMEQNYYSGYGLWVKLASGDDQLQYTFGQFANGKLNGACTTYYANGSYLTGNYEKGSREGDFVYVKADGTQFRYTYNGNELVTHMEIGMAEPLFICAFDNGSQYGYETQTANGTVVGGHGVICDGATYLFVGELNEKLMADGLGALGTLGENGAQKTVSVWKNNQLIADAAASTEAPENTPFKERALAPTATPVPTATLDPKASPLKERPLTPTATPVPTAPHASVDVTANPGATSSTTTAGDIEPNTLEGLINDIPYTFYLGQASLDSSATGYGIELLYLAFNPRGETEFTIHIFMNKSIAPGSYCSKNGKAECAIYLHDSGTTVWQANGLGDAYDTLGYYTLKITSRSSDWITYDGEMEAALQEEFNYDNVATLRLAKFNFTIGEQFTGDIPYLNNSSSDASGAGDGAYNIGLNTKNSVACYTASTGGSAYSVEIPYNTTVIQPEPTCSLCYGTGICPYCYGSSQMLNAYTGEYQDCICDHGECPLCGGSGLY